MAFWNKSDDPWDRAPGQTHAPSIQPAGSGEEPAEESGLVEQVKRWNEVRKAEKAEREAPPDPIPCPWCGKEMEASYLRGGRDGVYWQRERPGAFNTDSEQIDTDGGFWNQYKLVWHCPDCGKLVLDLQPRDRAETPESRTQQEYEDELRRYAEQAKKREGED